MTMLERTKMSTKTAIIVSSLLAFTGCKSSDKTTGTDASVQVGTTTQAVTSGEDHVFAAGSLIQRFRVVDAAAVCEVLIP